MPRDLFELRLACLAQEQALQLLHNRLTSPNPQISVEILGLLRLSTGSVKTGTSFTSNLPPLSTTSSQAAVNQSTQAVEAALKKLSEVTALLLRMIEGKEAEKQLQRQAEALSTDQILKSLPQEDLFGEKTVSTTHVIHDLNMHFAKSEMPLSFNVQL